MDGIKGFTKDDKGCYIGKVDDIELVVGVLGDTISLEQPGDHEDPDIVMIWSKDDAKEVVKLMQAWIDA